jgi:uncharacterized protein YjbI with pentapeptide repeats
MQHLRRTSFARLVQDDISATLARHELLHAGRMGGARAVFAFCDLSGLDLSRRNLADADFTGALLRETDLSGARLEWANFFGADLRRADLSGARLRRANLRGACLRGANLTGSDLCEADLREGAIAERETNANLRLLATHDAPAQTPGTMLDSIASGYARTGGPIAVQTDFTDAVMKDCRLVRANLRDAYLCGANMESADVSGCNLSGADLSGAILIGVRLDTATTQDTNLTGVLTDRASGREPHELSSPIEEILAAHARWVGTNGREGRPADLSRVDLRKMQSLARRMLTALIAPGANFYGMNLEGISLQGANLQGADLRSAKLAGADLRGVNLSGARLNYADLRDAKLGPLTINGTRLLPARLERVSARYADFRGADMRRANLTEADFAYAALAGADLRGADVTDADPRADVTLGRIPPRYCSPASPRSRAERILRVRQRASPRRDRARQTPHRVPSASSRTLRWTARCDCRRA